MEQRDTKFSEVEMSKMSRKAMKGLEKGQILILKSTKFTVKVSKFHSPRTPVTLLISTMEQIRITPTLLNLVPRNPITPRDSPQLALRRFYLT